MSLQQVSFYFISAIILIFSVLTIYSRKILRAATYLLIVLFATAALYYMLHYTFLGAVQLALYAGGIVVLIIFSILLTHHISHRFEKPAKINVIAGSLLALSGAAVAIYAILNYTFTYATIAPVDIDMQAIGYQMLSTSKNGYALPFEVISILLLAVMIGAIVIARKTDNNDISTKEKQND